MKNNSVDPAIELHPRPNTAQPKPPTASLSNRSEKSGALYIKVLYVLNALFFILLLMSIAAVVLAVKKSNERHEMAASSVVQYDNSFTVQDQNLNPVTISDSREDASYARLAQVSSDLDELRVVRLVGNTSNEFEGRVEIFHQGEWGAICGFGWNILDADIICHMLGYVNASDHTEICTFGCGTGRFWLENLECGGYEWDIRNCRHGGWGNISTDFCATDRSIHGDAGVTCTV